MSDSRTRLNLEHQRKRAKQLRRAHGDGNRDAAERIARSLPRARGWPIERVLAARFTLSEAQLVVAREAGYASWPALRRDLDAAAVRDVGAAIVDAALRGDDAAVDALVAREPSTAATAAAAGRGSIAVAMVLGDRAAAMARLAEDPASADRRVGARGWTPLLYLCCSRYRRGDAGVGAARAAIAGRLIELGVELDAPGAVPGLTSDNVTMFDEHEWRAIEGAAGCAASLALVRVLLDGGARLDGTSAVLAQAVIGGDLEVLAALLAASPPWWQVTWALKACAVIDRAGTAAAARMLGAHVGLPMMRGPAIDAAIRAGRSGELIEVLLGPGEPRERVEPVWRAAYRTAVRHDHEAAKALLHARGIGDDGLTVADRLIAAALAGDGEELVRWITAPEYDRGALGEDDHAVVTWAVATGRTAAVEILLAAGMDPGTRDRDGETPLHRAVCTGAAAGKLIDALIGAGAAVDARNFDGKTPLELARGIADDGVRDAVVRRLMEAGAQPGKMSQLVARGGDGGDGGEVNAEETEALRRDGAVEKEDPDQLFERAADAVAFGEIEALRELLDDEPDLVHARSPRPHRATLLHYCAANGTEMPRQRTPANAAAIAQLLIERGAEVEAACKLYGGGARTLGLMLTSAFPRAAGVDGELVRVLARGGAQVTGRHGGSGDSPLATAILHGAPRAAEALAEAGAPVDSVFAAAGLDRVEALAQMMAAGADVNERFAGGATALHAAAAMGYERAAEYLIAHGGDPRMRDHHWGNTPAGLAKYFGHTALASRLAAAADENSSGG